MCKHKAHEGYIKVHVHMKRLIFQVMSGPRKLSIKCRYSTTTYSRTNFNKTWTETLGIYPTKKHCFCISNEILLVSHTAYKLASLFCKKNQLIRVWEMPFFLRNLSKCMGKYHPAIKYAQTLHKLVWIFQNPVVRNDK